MTINSVVSTTNGSSTVSRVSGDIWDNVIAGAIFTVIGDNVNYVVAAIVPALTGGTVITIYLTAVYAGNSNANASASISMDFTPNKDLPLINTGDIEAASLFNRAMLILDTESLAVLPEHGPTHLPLGPDPIPFTDNVEGGIFPAVSGQPTDVLCGDTTSRDITVVGLQTFNALGNGSFEVDQANTGNSVVIGTSLTRATDRWFGLRIGTMAATAQQIAATAGVGGGIIVPNAYRIASMSFLRIQLTTSEPSLGASDYLAIQQRIEGPRLKELIGSGHSISMLARTTVSSLTFGVSVRDPAAAHSLVSAAVLAVPNVWTVVPVPNLPTWPSAGNFSLAAEALGYTLSITLASGSTLVTSANGSWQSGNFLGAIGQSNFASNMAGAQFDIAFIQHQPGVKCSALFDLPFITNREECSRYYQKSYGLNIKPGTIIDGQPSFWVPIGAQPMIPISFTKQMCGSPATMTAYSGVTGAAANVRNVTSGADVATTGAVDVSDNGFSGFTIASPTAAVTNFSFHWTADTGF